MSIKNIPLLSWVGIALGFAVLIVAVFTDFTDSMPTCKITAQQEERYDALYKDCLMHQPGHHPAACMEV